MRKVTHMDAAKLEKFAASTGHFDAGESAFFARQLEVIRAQTYDIKYPQLKVREFVPVDNSVSPGAEVVTYRSYDMVGLAKILANYADDLPRADVKGQEFTTKIEGIGASYGFSIQEVRAAQFAGVPLEQRKANAARRAIEEKIEVVGRSGDSARGLLGFLNQSNTTSFTVPATGTGSSTLWSTKTPDQILGDMNGIANGIVSSTLEIEIPDTLLLPTSRYAYVASTPRSSVSDTTILEFFLKANPYVKTVAPWYALETAGASSSARMVCYRRDPDALQMIIPQEFEQFPPQQRGLEIVTPCHARTGGVVMYYPLSLSYGDGI